MFGWNGWVGMGFGCLFFLPRADDIEHHTCSEHWLYPRLRAIARGRDAAGARIERGWSLNKGVRNRRAVYPHHPLYRPSPLSATSDHTRRKLARYHPHARYNYSDVKDPIHADDAVAPSLEYVFCTVCCCCSCSSS